VRLFTCALAFVLVTWRRRSDSRRAWGRLASRSIRELKKGGLPQEREAAAVLDLREAGAGGNGRKRNARLPGRVLREAPRRTTRRHLWRALTTR
jgi:hypothetical protein